MKVWNVATKRLENDLPGHADEVYAVDWSPDGSYVGSGALPLLSAFLFTVTDLVMRLLCFPLLLSPSVIFFAMQGVRIDWSRCKSWSHPPLFWPGTDFAQMEIIKNSCVYIASTTLPEITARPHFCSTCGAPPGYQRTGSCT